MLLNCPNCETIFRIDSAKLPFGGRMVRCSVCQHEWKAYRGGTDMINENRKPAARSSFWKRFVLLGFVLVVIAGGLTITRNTISALVPLARPIFENAGLAIGPDVDQLSVTELNGNLQRDTVRLSGELINNGFFPSHAPILNVTVTDSFGFIIAEKEITLEREIIPSRVPMPFLTQVALDRDLPDDEAIDIIVTPLEKLP